MFLEHYSSLAKVDSIQLDVDKLTLSCCRGYLMIVVFKNAAE